MSPVAAQEVARPVLNGEVLIADGPVDSATVVLHQVTVATSGEIDSVQVDSEGRFSFDLPSVPDPGGRGEVYFASVRRSGVLYFGPPVHLAVQLDTIYPIVVRDTAVVGEGGLNEPLDVRYLLIDQIEGGWQVTDLFQLQVAGERTLVTAGNVPLWRYPLPAGVRDLQLGNDDLPPDAARLADGQVQISGPIIPGERQFIIRYAIDELEFEVPAPGVTRQMEILVQEPAPEVMVQGLAPVPSVEIDPGVTYKRFAGANLQNPLIVVAAGAPSGDLPARMAAVVIALLLAGTGLWATQRSKATMTAPTPVRPSRVDLRKSLVLEVARTDAELERPNLTDAEANQLRAQRASLIRRIQDLG